MPYLITLALRHPLVTTLIVVIASAIGSMAIGSDEDAICVKYTTGKFVLDGPQGYFQIEGCHGDIHHRWHVKTSPPIQDPL